MLEGITIIAGKNGTGKSTIGKLLYCIGRTFYNADEHIREEKARQIYMLLNSRIREQIGMTRTRINRSAVYEMVDTYLLTGEIKYPEKVEQIINQSESKEENETYIKKTLEIYPITILKSIFDRAVEVELGNNIFPANHPRRTLQISFEKDNREVINISKEKGKELNIKSTTTLDKAVLFLDDPLIINDLSDNAESPLMYNRFSHRADLYEKLNNNQDKESVIPQIIGKSTWGELNDILNEMCGGKLEEVSGLGYRYITPVYREPLSIESLSMGIKSILAIKTMIENGSLNNVGLLIVDEPEVHLHPEWQFQLAKLLVVLFKVTNVKILLSTHSADFLSAINYYSKQYDLMKATHYYQTRKEKEYSIITDVTDQLDLIYQDLSAPFLNIAEKL